MKRNNIFFYLFVLFSAHIPPVIAETPSLIIEADWLASRINDERIVIVDARSESKYLKSHISNAVNLPVSSTFATGSRYDLVAPLSVISQLIWFASRIARKI